MTKSEVMDLLESNQDDRGLANWNKMGLGKSGLTSFGIGLTRLRKLAKQVGRDHRLALELWRSNNHDAKIMGLLIDDPKQITQEQAEEQVEEVDPGMLSHVFSSCDAPLAKAAFAFGLARDWIKSSDAVRRRCGYGLLYELSKNTRNNDLTDAFWLDCIRRINDTIADEDDSVRLAMGGALMGIGKRNTKLNQAAIKVAKAIGPIEYETLSGDCGPLDILKHLTSDRLKKKLGG